MKTDLEISREVKLKRIEDIAKQNNINTDNIVFYGKYIAKIPTNLVGETRNNLILVTAITPTKAGIGKTTVSISLALGLNKLGKRAVVALREPSLGPCFGMKGGAAGGGYAQVLPMEDINLHFTGDFHAITSAHNMITAMLDNYIYQNKDKENGLSDIIWKRVLDVNDRNLRSLISGLGSNSNGVLEQTGFDITAASEIMAILCLANDLNELKEMIERIILGYRYDKTPFTVKDLGVAGAATVLLKDAINPNLVQTTEGGAAFVHGGPFANIAHGCNSLIATKMAITYGDYAITEAGFGADLGAEKFFNIKCRRGGFSPILTVLVVTSQSLKMHGGIELKNIKEPNMLGLVKGFDNLDKHIDNLKKFGQSIVVAFNQYANDSQEEIKAIQEHCESMGVSFAVNNAFSQGSAGAIELANTVLSVIDNNPSTPLRFIYDNSDSIKTKIQKVTQEIYSAGEVHYSKKAERVLKQIEQLGVEHYPICIAKTQYSFTDDPTKIGVFQDFEMTVRDIEINNGAEMIIIIMGDIMRMPGLPKTPQANLIDIVDGVISGLS